MLQFKLNEKTKEFDFFSFLSWNHGLQPFPMRPRSGFMQCVSPVNSFPDRLRDAGWRGYKLSQKRGAIAICNMLLLTKENPGFQEETGVDKPV